MIAVIVAAISVSLVIIFCCRHFFVQLLAFKLFIDALVVALACIHKAGQNTSAYQTSAWIIAGFGGAIFFISMAIATRLFSQKEKPSEALYE